MWLQASCDSNRMLNLAVLNFIFRHFQMGIADPNTGNPNCFVCLTRFTSRRIVNSSRFVRAV